MARRPAATAERLRDDASARSPARGTRGDGTGAPPPASAVELRLAVTRGRLGLELARPLRVDFLELNSLAIRFDDVKFPVDLSGGVHRFRHRRGLLAHAAVEILLARASDVLLDRVRRALPSARRLSISPSADGLVVGVLLEHGAVAFDLLVTARERDVVLVVENARAESIDDVPHALACRAVGALTGDLATRIGSAFELRDPFGALARRLLPDAGARAPATRELRVVRVEPGDSSRIVVEAAVDAAPHPLSNRAVRALETVELLADADDALIRGDHEAARAGYLDALERAPRHPEASHRLSAIDAIIGSHAEAALATLVEITNVVDAGLLGSRILEAVGEHAAAHAAAARASADEPFGPLAARGWLRASRLALDREAKLAALDDALTRWPAFDDARWQRLGERLASGDLRGAIADSEHLEAQATTRDARHDVARRAGELFHERGFPEEASRLFERALRFEPKSPAAVVGLARSMRDLGRTNRAVDLFARALALAVRLGQRAHDIELELAAALATYCADLPAAVARAAGIPQDVPEAPRARLLEATWRFALGDRAGASRALGRLRAIAEVAAPNHDRVGLASQLVEAARLEERQLEDLKAAERGLALAIRVDPSSQIARRELARVARELAPREPVAIPAPARAPSPPPPPPAPLPTPAPPDFAALAAEDADDLEALVDQLTARLRADPSDSAAAEELALALERLGRDLDLLALLSARIDECADEERPAWLERRNVVLDRLAAQADAEGRASEAELYRMMKG
ncbi:MAG: hypothetical protein U0271_17825 [Polyangiaceae bacterium]